MIKDLEMERVSCTIQVDPGQVDLMTRVLKNGESALPGSRKDNSEMQKHHLEDGMRRIPHPTAGSEKGEARGKDQERGF